MKGERAQSRERRDSMYLPTICCKGSLFLKNICLIIHCIQKDMNCHSMDNEHSLEDA